MNTCWVLSWVIPDANDFEGTKLFTTQKAALNTVRQWLDEDLTVPEVEQRIQSLRHTGECWAFNEEGQYWLSEEYILE